MNFRIIINSIIVIFIIHIIILNINASYNIGKKKNIENFEDKDTKNNKDSMNFLTSNNDVDNDDFKKKLLKYIQVDDPPKITEFEKKNLIKVEASNTYLNDNNVPNFESNVADISKFYKVNYDNLSENELKSTSIDTLKNTTTSIIDTKKDSTIDPYVRQSTVNPDNWSYKDEIPMNGGLMNGIVGFDSLESQFAMFNPNKLNLETPDSNKFENIPHDDLRKPIVYEN